MNFRKILSVLSARWRGLSLWGRYALAGFVVVFIVGGIYFLKGNSGAQATEAPNFRAVQVASVSDLESDATPLPLIGEVQSANEAQIHAETGGSITHLYHKLGDYVPAGGIIAEIDNASERAAVLSAQGALEAAQASVSKSGKLYTDSRVSAADTIKSVYSTNDDLIHTKTDVMFANPRTYAARFVLSVTDQNLLNKVLSERLQIENILKQEDARGDTLTSNSDLKTDIETTIQETRIIKSYLDDLSMLLNVSVSSETYSQATINGFIATASAARSAVSASLASLTGTSQALTNTQTTADKPGEASASDAAIKQAQGSLDAAKANLEKTIIRAPISGTLNNLSIHLGDFVSGFQQVAIISNNGALEIVAHITPEDRATISSNAKVRIENEYDGAISSIAPAIDPPTKKIEIKIRFNGRAADLTNGESVHLDIVRNPKKTAKSLQITLPISTVKIGSESSVVFTVNEDKKLVAHPVKTGDLIGDKIVILEGVTEDMMLVTDARGLKDGQQVDLQ